MSYGSHISIGELLEELRADFPDVTISKVRFLESQGLINPERTPSGYRKFYPPDVMLLRWILQQQRDNFLPLKEIRRRIEDGEAPSPSATTASSTVANVGSGLPDQQAYAAQNVQNEATSGIGASAVAMSMGSHSAVQTDIQAVPVGGDPRSAGEPGPMADSQNGQRGAEAPAPPVLVPPGPHSLPAVLEDADEPLSLSAEEVCAQADITLEALAELERYGLMAGKPVGGVAYYDADALSIAQLSREFARHGVEARHLRLHRLAVDREVGFLEQRVATLVRQRNPEARREARGIIEDLVRLGADLHYRVLRAAMRTYRDRL